ncbi:hypothetical protein ACFQZE_24455 [Paenibacillus sp. GCM10027627]|uniref:hypothetical protein n=1 Tax=unclassified Paenibacillus TaxID=185978 RepID=UPI0036414F4F
MEFDLTQMVGVIGVPGALCFVLIQQINKMRDTIDNNTKALVALATIVKGGHPDGGQ